MFERRVIFVPVFQPQYSNIFRPCELFSGKFMVILKNILIILLRLHFPKLFFLARDSILLTLENSYI